MCPRGDSVRARLLLSFLVLLVVPPMSSAAQTFVSTQAAAKSRSAQPRWTEADRKKLLAKARSGDAGSQMWLAAAYEQGWFGKKDIPEALKWCRKSAKRGNADAQNELGRMYEEGEGIRQNYILAARWYRRAAEHLPDLGGAGQGRNNLGILYLEGRGVPRDYVQAYMWFSLFGREQNPNLALARQHLTETQISEAERMANEWKSRHHASLPARDQLPGKP